MTKKIFYEDAYRTQYRANIIERIEDGKHYKLVCDATIFYPEGGGQPSDRGTINGIEVLDVQEQDGIILHIMTDKVQGEIAEMSIDWQRRFDFMQQHTGEHLLSGIILRECGGNNRGFHMGADFVTIDIDIPKMSWEMLGEIEEKVNAKIAEKTIVQDAITNREGLSRFPIRKEIKAQGDIRVVTIEGADCCACCGTHTSNLSEVGMLKILKTEQYKGMTRIHFVCGNRASKDYAKRFEITRELKKQLNADEERIVERVVALKNELEKAKFELYHNRQFLAKYMAKECLQENTQELLIKNFEQADYDLLMLLAEQLRGNYPTMILSSGDGRVVAETKKTLDMGALFKEALAKTDGKGGGKGSKAQAMFEDMQNMESFIRILKEKIEKADE